MSKRVFAIGLGFNHGGTVEYTKSFTHTDKNDDAVQDFLTIITKELGYQQKSTVMSLAGIDLAKLKDLFQQANHGGTADFLKEAKNDLKRKKKASKKRKKAGKASKKSAQIVQSDAIITIMADNSLPTCKEESFLLLDLFSSGTFNSLNEEQRHPLTKVFASLNSIPLTSGGLANINEEWMEAFDKFPSYLEFKGPGSNRFAPTSFVRYGASLGNENVLMMGAAVNFGVSIGNGNLLDGHCSVASCAQIGDNNKIGSFVSIEGVLSPVNAQPVIIKNDNFFGTNCRVGTGLVIGNDNFWSSGVNLSVGTTLMDLRPGSATRGKYVKAGTTEGIQDANNTMIIVNRAKRSIDGIDVLPGEFLLSENTEENQERFKRNDDLTSNN